MTVGCRYSVAKIGNVGVQKSGITILVSGDFTFPIISNEARNYVTRQQVAKNISNKKKLERELKGLLKQSSKISKQIEYLYNILQYLDGIQIMDGLPIKQIEIVGGILVEPAYDNNNRFALLERVEGDKFVVKYMRKGNEKFVVSQPMSKRVAMHIAVAWIADGAV